MPEPRPVASREDVPASACARFSPFRDATWYRARVDEVSTPRRRRPPPPRDLLFSASLFVASTVPPALRRHRVGARTGVGRALLRLRRAAHRRRARLFRRHRHLASLVPLARRVQRHCSPRFTEFSARARTSPPCSMPSPVHSSALFVHRLARYELSPARARVAGLITALYPGLIVYSALVMTEPLSALAGVVAGWVWVRHRGARRWLGAALFWLDPRLGSVGSSELSRVRAGAGVLLAQASGPHSSLTSPALRRRVALVARSPSPARFVPVLPWTLRNCRVMDRCDLVSTNGGWNLAIGAFRACHRALRDASLDPTAAPW